MGSRSRYEIRDEIDWDAGWMAADAHVMDSLGKWHGAFDGWGMGEEEVLARKSISGDPFLTHPLPLTLIIIPCSPDTIQSHLHFF